MNKENIYNSFHQEINKEDFQKAMWYLWKHKLPIDIIYPDAEWDGWADEENQESF